VFWHVTQNVDSLLTKAGCELLSELHGCSARVDCGYKSLAREELQEIILKQNPNRTAQSNTINLDADVHLNEEQLGDLKSPRCDFLKEQSSKSDSVLVAGSSLEVMSSYRFILAAQQLKMPIAIINIGRIRGDHAAQLRISTRCGSILPLLQINS
ncbi:unnamed protein product, partial [Rotaria magnacalcarata]